MIELHASGIITEGDAPGQAVAAWTVVAESLAAAGRSLSDVVGAYEYVTTPAADGLAAIAARRTLDLRAPVQQVVVAAGVAPGSEVQVSVVVADDSLVFLPSVGPFDEAGDLVGGDDLVAQTRAAYANVDRLLAERGLRMSNVTMTIDYLTLAGLKQYKGTGDVRRDVLSRPYPGSAGIIMDRLADERALMGLDVLASTEPLTGVNPGWERYAKLTYLPGVIGGDVVYLSGQAALDPPTEMAVHAGDVVEQARYTYGNIVTVLASAGLGPDALAGAVEYYTPAGLARRAEVAAVRREVLGFDPVVVELACTGLLRREFELEVIPIARGSAR
jgi:enamine deaminase RidA (YjgF/YER057c/UK114 family)